MANESRWERKAKMIYEGTKWQKAAMDAARAMDNRMDRIASGPYGSSAPSSIFDMQIWLKWFDYDILKQRGLVEKASIIK